MMRDCSAAEQSGGGHADTVAGFTIVETLVAVLLLIFGVLALMSAAASLPAVVARGRLDQQLAVIAMGELERLRLTACDGATSGERSAGTRTVSWTVVEEGAGVVRLRVIVAGEAGRWMQADTLTGSVKC